MRSILILIFFGLALSGRVTRKIATCPDRVTCDSCLSRSTCVFVQSDPANFCIHKSDRIKYKIGHTISNVSECGTHSSTLPAITTTPGPEGENLTTTDTPKLELDTALDDFHPIKTRALAKILNERLQPDQNQTHCDHAIYVRETWQQKMYRSMCRTYRLMTRNSKRLTTEQSVWNGWNPMSSQSKLCDDLEKNRLQKPRGPTNG